MARPRKSRRELELTGAIKKNPQRFRDRFANRKSHGQIGAPPKWMSVEEKRAWREFVRIAPPDSLTVADRIALGDMCRIWARYVEFGENLGGKSKGVPARSMTRLKDYLARFGMTPLDRTKLHLPKPVSEGNEFEDLDKSPYAEFDLDPKIN